MALYIAQFSVDIADDGDLHVEDVKRMLEEQGLDVVGASWKATWYVDEYDKGMPPLFSD